MVWEGIMLDDRAYLHVFEKGSAIDRVRCFARSPDLNPIEHVWDSLGRVIETRNTPLKTIQGLETELLNEWYYLPQGLINSLISGLKSWCEACTSVGKDHTPY
ncbi:transposable element Tc1 transposase [Trichonephila clavipes]|nr:transposable element Tc1 transposase [Trichonephila clavipes]